MRRLEKGCTQFHANLLRDHLLRPGRIEPDRATRYATGIDVTENDHCIGQRRLGAPFAVGRRPGRRASARRPDAQQPELANSSDAAASCADFGNVDNRQFERVPTTLDQLAADIDPGANLVFVGA